MSKQAAMSVYLSNENTKKYLQSILGERTGQFITSLTSLAGSSAELQNCDRNSLLSCALKATSMNLPFDPNLGFAWAVPYGNIAPRSRCSHGSPFGQTLRATFQVGSKGYTQLALRTGQYRSLNARDVSEGEFAGRDFVGDPIINWLPDEERANQKVIGYMAGLELTNGFRKVIYWSVQDVEKHAERYSQGYRYYLKNGASKSQSRSGNRQSPWASDFDKMAEKTVLKALISKYGIMSTDMQQAVQYDQSSINIDMETGEEQIEYLDNPEAYTIRYLSREEQSKLLEKYGADKVSRALDDIKIKSLNEVTENKKESLIEVLEAYEN